MKTITIEMTERQYNMAVYYAKKYYPQYKSLRPIIKLAMAEKVRAMAKRELPMNKAQAGGCVCGLRGKGRGTWQRLK